MSKWTPEPWKFDDDKSSFRCITGSHPGDVCAITTPCDGPSVEDANRIVACVNALAGVPDPDGYLRRLEEAVLIYDNTYDMEPALAAEIRSRREGSGAAGPDPANPPAGR